VACSRAKKILVLSYSQFEDTAAADDAENNNKRAKETVPFFGDLLKKESHLRPLDSRAKEFLYGLCPDVKTYKCFDLVEMKKMFGESRDNKIINTKHIKIHDWKQTEKKLGLLVGSMEKSLKGGQDISGVLNGILESPHKIHLSSSVIKGSSKYLDNIRRSYNKKKTNIGPYPDIIAANRGDQLLFSLTPVLDYLECPSMYKWRYVYSIPQRPDKKMIRGELIHKYIENSTRLRFEDPGALQNFSLQEYYPEEIRPYLDVFDKSIFADFSVNRPEKLMLEQLFYYRVGEYYVTGKLDRVAVYLDGHAEIVDYKMSGQKTENNTGSAGHIPERYRQQLMTYIGAVSDILRTQAKEIKGLLLYLGNGKIHSVSGSSYGIDEIKGVLSGAIQHISNGDFNTLKETECKKDCQYFKLCFDK
jgi:hypothetical protein